MKKDLRKMLIIVIVVLMVLIGIILSKVIFNKKAAVPQEIWEKEIKNIFVNPSGMDCISSSPKQSFRARLSKQAPGTIYKGTFLHLSGSPTDEYIYNINSDNYDARKKLEYELWKKGFKILELKFSSKTGWNPYDKPDEQWNNTGLVCETEPLVNALEVLNKEGMWPNRQEDRYAMGTSNGALMLAYAVDYHRTPYAKVHRVLLQSPIAYDLFSQCKEMPISPFTDFYYKEQCRNADNNKKFFEQQQIKSSLSSRSCEFSIGENSFLIVGGKNGEVASWYKDEFSRYVPDRERLCGKETASWDAPEKYFGHHPMEDYYKEKGNVNAFVDYFLDGSIDFS